MSGNYSIMSFGQYWDDNNYNTKTNTNSGYDSYDYQDDTSVFATESYTTSPYGSIFGGDVDYSSSYDAIFDQFHKTLAEMQAQDDETSDGSDVTGSQGGQAGDGSDTQVGGSDGDLTGDNAYGDAAGSQGASGEVSGADGSGDNQGQQPQVELLRSEQVRSGFDADAIATSLHGASEPGIFGWGTNESVFEKYFDVYADNQIEARYILTTGFMERLVNIAAKNRKCKVSCSFIDGYMYIALDGKDWFDIPASKSFKEIGSWQRVLVDFIDIFRILDELKVEQNIGM